MRYGAEPLQAATPSLVLLARGERDENTFVGEFDAYWCLFQSQQVRSIDGREVVIEFGAIKLRGSHLRMLSDFAATSAVNHFQELLASARRPDPAARLRASGKLLELLAMWAEPASSAQDGKSLVVRYRNAIEEQATNAAMSFSELAAQLGYSSNHLGTMFKREMGMSPVEYRNRLRLGRARELLLASLASVAEIAAAVGIPDANYFTRLFRTTIGVSPRRFVHQHRLNFSRR